MINIVSSKLEVHLIPTDNYRDIQLGMRFNEFLNISFHGKLNYSNCQQSNKPL